MWEAVRFLCVPREPLLAVAEAIGLPVSVRFKTEAEYQASLRDDAFQHAHAQHFSASFSPYGRQQMPPKDLEEYSTLRLQLIGDNNGVPNVAARIAISNLHKSTLKSFSET